MYVACACTGDENVGEYNYAVIELQPEYVEWLKGRLQKAQELRAEDDNFYALEYFDYNASYFSKLSFEVEDGEFEPCGPDAAQERWAKRVGTTTVVITTDTICWSGSPKHIAGVFETATMDIDTLEELVETAV